MERKLTEMAALIEKQKYYTNPGRNYRYKNIKTSKYRKGISRGRVSVVEGLSWQNPSRFDKNPSRSRFDNIPSRFVTSPSQLDENNLPFQNNPSRFGHDTLPLNDNNSPIFSNRPQ